MKKNILYIIIIVALATASSACSEKKENILEKIEMFSLNYGKMDDEIMLMPDIGKNNYINPHIAEVAMQDGIFYITNSCLKKVMKFNSYGDILALYYNEEQNPDPFIAKKNEEKETSNIKAIPFSFNEIGSIAVNREQKLFVSDFMPESKHVWDDEHKTMLTDIIYCFDSRGNYIDFLGQEGFGGMAFPMITKITATADNHLVVNTKVPKGEIIYWFDEKCRLLYTIEFPYEYLPIIEHKPIIASLGSISAPQSGFFLFLKIDYYLKEIDQKTQKETDILFYKSVIYKFDIEKQEYIDFLEIPNSYSYGDSNKKMSGMASEKLETLYQMLGVYGREDIFLISLINDFQYNLLIINLDGSIIGNTKINIESGDFYLTNLNLNANGIITGLFAADDKISAVWWRSDKIISKKNEKK